MLPADAQRHASALADLMDTIGAFELEEGDREYIEELGAYALEVKPEDGGDR